MNDDPCDDMPMLRPFDLDKAAAAKDINDLLNHYVTVMDTKASAFLAGNVAAATFLLREMPAAGLPHFAYLAAATLFATSTLIAGGVIFPRVPTRGTSILFWGDIAAQPNVASYVTEFNRAMESGFLDEQYCIQNWFTAQVLRRKFRWLRASIALFFVALFVAFLVYVNP